MYFGVHLVELLNFFVLKIYCCLNISDLVGVSYWYFPKVCSFTSHINCALWIHMSMFVDSLGLFIFVIWFISFVNLGGKWANALFGKNKLRSALFLKLIREIPLFCNSIIVKSSYVKNSISLLLSYLQLFATLVVQRGIWFL